MDYDSLVLRVAQRSARYPEDALCPPGASADILTRTRFVPPTFTEVISGDTGDLPTSPPNVILIYASAAVGKTTLARALAEDTNNPYWDLAQFTLGSYFFQGTISKAYGVGAIADFISELKSSGLTLILDAADEASVGSTTSGYLAALNDLSSLLGGTNPPLAQAVILGRHDAILEAASRLVDAGLQVDIVEVDYFDEAQAKEFVTFLAAPKTGKPLPELYDFIDLFFTRVAGAFGEDSWSGVRAFLGYAPVLDSLATYYREADNAFARLQKFSAPDSYLAVWELLSDLILDIMNRDCEKFAVSFGGQNEAKRRFARSSYSSEFQVRMLLSRDPMNVCVSPELLDEVDPDWLVNIDSAAREWFKAHPFVHGMVSVAQTHPLKVISNVAFRDFVVALVVRMGDSGLTEMVAALMASHEVNPSVMFSRFIEVDASRGFVKELPMSMLPALLDSRGAGGTEVPMTFLFEEDRAVDDPEDGVKGRRTMLLFGGRRSVLLEVSGEGPVEAGRMVTNAIILTSRSFVFGSMSPESQLGPNVYIKCEELVSRSPELRVTAGDGLTSVIIAKRISGSTRLIHGPLMGLEARVPPVTYPWERFRTDVHAVGSIRDGDLVSLALDLRGLTQWFLKGKGKFRASVMDTLVAKGRVSSKMLSHLLMEDCVWRDGRDYRFSSPFPPSVIQSVNLDLPEYRRWLEAAFKAFLA